MAIFNNGVDLLMLSYYCIFFCRFEDVIDVQIHNRNVAQINFKDRSVVFYTNRVMNKYSFVNVSKKLQTKKH